MPKTAGRPYRHASIEEIDGLLEIYQLRLTELRAELMARALDSSVTFPVR
jgi:hypothetical protein